MLSAGTVLEPGTQQGPEGTEVRTRGEVSSAIDQESGHVAHNGRTLKVGDV
jgi:hypothetical protein